MTPVASKKARHLIALSTMLATLMQSLDSTIVVVALPHMQGTMSATQDQVAWVLTSYIVAAAIFMPLTGFLVARFGRKRLFLWSVAGFTVASMLCGVAPGLHELVLFRLMQGMFGAFLTPLSQATLLDTYPPEEHGPALAMWGVGIMVGPILGPTVGGILTEYISWRWIFFINLPFGLLAWFGLVAFLRETPVEPDRHFDLPGFAFISIAIGALQLFLDRGEHLGWFVSQEIIIEATLAGVFLYLFLVHIFTAPKAFLEPGLFVDRNYCVGLVLASILGLINLASMVLLSPFMQGLLGTTVVDVGNTMAPGGMTTMVGMALAGRLIGKVDLRYPIFIGCALVSYSLWEMSLFGFETTRQDVMVNGLIRGAGIGLAFIPISSITFSTLAPRYRNEGTAFYQLLRNIGSSIGVSIAITLLAQAMQTHHAGLASYINPFNLSLNAAVEAGAYDLASARGLTAINAEVSRQAALLSYLEDFRLFWWTSMILLPFIAFLRTPAHLRAR